MGRNSRHIKNRACELMDEYDQAMIEDLLKMATDECDGMDVESIDEDFWLGILQSWSPKDPSEWAFNQVQSEIDDYADAKYEEEKDRRMGL